MKPLPAKKSLGQNFLHRTSVLKKISALGTLGTKNPILEVGPGKGALTSYLCESGEKIIAVEKDDRLIPHLQERFTKEISQNKLTLVHEDILLFDPLTQKLSEGAYAIVANIPYYITGQFIRRFLSEKIQPEKMVLLLQKEVAKRIVAKDKKESLLSISIKVYGNPKYIETVKKENFSPRPKVDSAILLIENISKGFFADVNEEKFFSILKKGFAHKRKILLSNLDVPKEKRKELSLICNFEEKVRPEDLTKDQWKILTQNL